VEDENLTGDGVLETVSLANHLAVLSCVSEELVAARTACIRAAFLTSSRRRILSHSGG
jgi:hypothetical protein